MGIFKAKKGDDELGFWPTWVLPAPAEPVKKTGGRRKVITKRKSPVKQMKSARA